MRIRSLFTLTHNGTEIDMANALPVGSPALGDPGDCFAGVCPHAPDGETMIRRGGKSPETDETVTRTGDSLQEEQDRVLHVQIGRAHV